MGLYGIKPRFQQALAGVVGFLVRRRVHPDVLTLSAVTLACLGGAALYGSHWAPWLLLLLPPVALGRTALNALDGLVAAGAGLARPWGEVLNEFCDRLSDTALFTGLALARGSDARLGAAALVLMLLASYLGTLSKAAGGRRQYGGVMGKADRLAYLSLASVVAFALPDWPVFTYFLVFVIGGVTLTLIQRFGATYAGLQSGR